MQSKNDPFQMNDIDMHRDFFEVWNRIEESIKVYEMNQGK
jgi:hypothetical protein